VIQGLFVDAVPTTMDASAAHRYTSKVRATGAAAGRIGAIASALLGANLLHAGKHVYFLTVPPRSPQGWSVSQ
jgi:hypothetical protein